jgi:tRNA1(Val) A37 N6-methylase TrmN6
MNDFNKEMLQNGIFVYTSKEHTFGTDAILLADFASPSKNSKVIDFGSGCGIIPLFFYSRGKGKEIYGLELQEKGYIQLKSAIDDQNIKSVIAINADLKNIKGILPFGTFDVVTMNPPYKKLGGGIISAKESDKIARHETQVNIYDICVSAANLLKFGGRLCLCNRPERLATTIDAMKKAGIEPKRLRMVTQRYGKSPWLFLIEGKKGRNEGMVIDPELYIEEGNSYSEEYKRIYKDYQG